MRIKTMEQYHAEYAKSVASPGEFWSGIAEQFVWRSRWTSNLEWEFTTPSVNWFLNGKLNVTESCLDRYAQEDPERVAFYWEPNDPSEERLTITYRELFRKVCRLSNALRRLGVNKGDRVCIYLPMLPEAVVAMLACARIGAVHSVVFAGFSAQAVADRINDSGCSVVLTSDGSFRGDKTIALKEAVDEALLQCSTVRHVVVFRRTGQQVSMQPGRDLDWNDVCDSEGDSCSPEIMDSEDPLFILYTSGSTGKPKGVVHTCGGFMVFAAYTFLNVFQYDAGDIYWCTADVGWITGHSYIVYGPLLCGATNVLFEGVPTYPDAGRFWQVVDRYKVTHFYTAPTAIRALQLCGSGFPASADLSSLKVLGSVGEPINREAWQWYHEHVGRGRCPIVDTWWQTETGGIMISALAGITPEKPTYATLPLPGVQPVLVSENGETIEGNNVEGNLCIRFPWPGMIRTTYRNHERCRLAYFATYPGLYFTGDGCRRDENGYYRITGRVDDVMNVSGHRIGTAEVENAINLRDEVIETAVVGYPHDIKGQGIYAFCICSDNGRSEEEIIRGINASVTKAIGAIARPDKVQLVRGLPKTRSGKIMRRLLRKIAEGNVDALGDTSTLLDPQVVNEIIEGRK